MTLRTIGAVPGTQLHPQLNGTLEFLEIRLGELNGQIASLQASLDAMANLDLDLGQLQASLDAFLSIAASVDLDLPTAKLDVAAKLNADLQLLASLSAQLSLYLGDIDAALNLSAVHAWSYDGAASKFGELLTRDTSRGFGTGFSAIDPSDEIRAAVFASSSATNWATFSAAVFTGFGNTGVSSNDAAGVTTGSLNYLGGVPGATLFIQLGLAFPQLSLKLDAILALMLEIQANLALLLTVDFGIGVSLAISGALALGVAITLPSVDLSLEIALELSILLALRLALEPIVVQLRATISGAGVHLWAYEGPAGQLGSEFAAATRGGVAGGAPSDRSFGLVLATDDVGLWAAVNDTLKVY